MNTLYLSISILAVLAITAALTYRQFVRPLDDVKIKWALIVATLLVGIVGEMQLVFLAGIPAKADEYLAAGAAKVEEAVNADNPGATSKTIAPETLRNLLDDKERMTDFIDSTEGAGFIVDFIGARALLGSIDYVCDEMEAMLDDFERRNEPLTLHNVMDYTMLRAKAGVAETVRTVQIAVLVLTLICFLAIIALYFSAVKGWFTTRTSGVTFGPAADRL